ncbi:MAG: 5'-nucleotidase C-terminal domain-containing protein [Deltaproteobacteria bacterium]|nr:5'-nucleotidase C-terminal domain-containing protein [Deltaproteobacteria bacterium]
MRLTLLHTADWHSRLFPYQFRVPATDVGLGLQQEKGPFGGAARMNWLIQRERSRADRVLHLDTGDCFQGAPVFNFFGGEAELRALAHTGVDAVVIGNHEFDRGALNLYRQFNRWGTFQTLASNYLFEDSTIPGSAELGRIARPYAMFNLNGLRVAVIGFGNLSSITSIFDQPNRTGITPLNARETAQFYIDQVINSGADVVVGLSHLGLEDDHRMIQNTTGFDVILGGHLHIVTNPTQEETDCAPEDPDGSHWVPDLIVGAGGTRSNPNTVCDETAAPYCCSHNGVCPPDPARGASYAGWRLAPGYQKRACYPRRVLVQHSGAFMKYLGRLDLVMSNNPDRIGEGRLPPGATGAMLARHRFEVLGSRYTLFPVDSSVPEEPTMRQLLEPYQRTLDTAANLDTLVGYSPNGISRTNVGGGDSPMGNLVANAMWRRLGVQTDFAVTNTLGIRDSIPPGPVSIDQVYNVFPFDNSITTLQLSGREVLEMFDFIARRSGSRGCNSQAQIAGSRVVITCGSCDRDGVAGNDRNADGNELTGCAETVNIGLRQTEIVVNGQRVRTGAPLRCDLDEECSPPGTIPQLRSLCEPHAHLCMEPLNANGSYSLAANDFIAGGGSGFFVLQRNTTQVNTRVELRDAVIDFVQAQPACGSDTARQMDFRRLNPGSPPRADDGLLQCSTDSDCSPMGPEFSCAWSGRYAYDSRSMPMCSAASAAPSMREGRCIFSRCGTELAAQLAANCPAISPAGDPNARERCLCATSERAANTCRILPCFDASTGADSDARLRMVSRR